MKYAKLYEPLYSKVDGICFVCFDSSEVWLYYATKFILHCIALQFIHRIVPLTTALYTVPENFTTLQYITSAIV